MTPWCVATSNRGAYKSRMHPNISQIYMPAFRKQCRPQSAHSANWTVPQTLVANVIQANNLQSTYLSANVVSLPMATNFAGSLSQLTQDVPYVANNQGTVV